MTNREIFIKPLKLTGLRRMLISESKWTRLFTITTGCNVTHMYQFGSDYIALKMKVTCNPFLERNSFISSICGLSQNNPLGLNLQKLYIKIKMGPVEFMIV